MAVTAVMAVWQWHWKQGWQCGSGSWDGSVVVALEAVMTVWQCGSKDGSMAVAREAVMAGWQCVTRSSDDSVAV